MSKLTTVDIKLKKIKTTNNLNNKIISSNNIKNDSLSKRSNNSSNSLNNNISTSLKNENKKKNLYHEKSKKHPKCSSCANKPANIVYKNKSALSNFILMNLMTKKNYYHPNLKLLGNSRYKHTSPLLFVEDQKNNTSNESYGLIPIPLEKFKNKEKIDEEIEEKKNLYELQRSIVMSRRFQYNKDKNKWKNKYYGEEENDIFKKIILIQKWWKNYLKKNETSRKMKKFEKKIKNFNNKFVFNQLKELLLKKTILNGICFISKIKINNFIDKIRKIQHKIRLYLKGDKFRKESKIKKNRNIICYISKDRYKYSFEYINESAKKIENNFRIFQIKNKGSDSNIKNNLIKNKFDNKNKDNNNRNDNENNNIDSYKNGSFNSGEKNELINSEDNNNLMKNKNNEGENYNNNDKNKEKNINSKDKNNYLNNNKYNALINKNEKKNIINDNNIKIINNNNNKNKREKKDKIEYDILNDITNFQKEKKNNNDDNNKNNKKIIKFVQLITKPFYSYMFDKINHYIDQPIINEPKIFICYITKENIVKIKQNEKHQNQYIIKKYDYNDNKIEKLEIEINNNNDYIEKIYRKPIINGRSFKYQYYFSNNPYSYMNVSYISKILIESNDIYNQIYKYYKNLNKINNNKPKKSLKEIKNNDEHLESEISSGKNSNVSKRNSRLSLSYISERKRLSKFRNNNNEIIQIVKNYKNGHFISKKIFNHPKKDIIKIQKHIRKKTLTKNKVFKRPSYAYMEKKNLTNENIDNDSKNFDTENVKAKIIFNKFSDSSKKSKNELEENDNYSINNLNQKNKDEIISDDYLNNNNIKNDNKNEESLNDSAIITKIKLNYDSNSYKENENEEDNNNYIMKNIHNSKDIFYITKIRIINNNKFINMIQKAIKYHLYLKNSKNNFTNIRINAFHQPKNKNCYFSVQRFSKTKTDRYMFIYNPKIKYLIFILKLFIIKNVQDYIFKVIKNKNKNVDNNKNYFGFPFYIQCIKRVMNYLNNKKNTNANKKVFFIFNEILNNSNNNKFKSIINKLCFLSEKDEGKLMNSNLFTGYEENELINFLCDFSEFDKNLNNEEFLIERLKQTKLNNTNIFTLIKIIDVEYENLVKGEYCFKCYDYLSLCKCYTYINQNKDELKNENNNYDDIDMEEDNDILDSELNDNEDIEVKRKINCFCYNTNNDNKENILIIKTKLNENKSKKIIDIIIPNENIWN